MYKQMQLNSIKGHMGASFSLEDKELHDTFEEDEMTLLIKGIGTKKHYFNNSKEHFNNITYYYFLPSKSFKTTSTNSIRFNINEYNHYHSTNYNGVKCMNGKEYLLFVSKKHDKISLSKDTMSGMPVIHGRRIPVSVILACLRDGMTIKDICEDYRLSETEVHSSLDYIIDLLDRPFYEE